MVKLNVSFNVELKASFDQQGERTSGNQRIVVEKNNTLVSSPHFSKLGLLLLLFCPFNYFGQKTVYITKLTGLE